MSDEKMNESEKNASPDELAKTKKPGDVQLNEEELGKVSGGAVEIFLKLDGIDGESQDTKHKAS